MIYSQFILDLQRNSESLFRDYEKISTGKKLNRPSDDPAAMTSIIGGKARMISIEAFQEAITTANNLLNTTTTSLGGLSKLVDTAKQIGNDATSLNASDRATFASLVQNTIQSVIGLANTKLGDRYIFSGYRTDQPAVNATTGAFQGSSNRIAVAINTGISVDVNITADEFIASGQVAATATNSAYLTAAGGFTSPIDVFTANGGTLGISLGGGPTTNVSIAPGATLSQVRDAVNTANTGIRAEVVNNNVNGSPADYRLMLSATPASSASVIGVTVTSADGAGTGLNTLAPASMTSVVSPDTTIIGAMSMLKTAIEQGDQAGIQRSISALKNTSAAIADKQADVGIRLNKVKDMQGFLREQDKNITDQVSSELILNEVEIARLITQSQLKQTSLESLRSISSTLLQTNMFDFLK
jgi:flagellar hook-associated protein 3 FlgL